MTKDDYYGVLSTYNVYDKTWYSFSRRDVDYYWAKRDFVLKGKGNTAEESVKNYLTLKNEKTN